jgi:RNA polymerase sigma factor (sigma-70 family)
MYEKAGDEDDRLLLAQAASGSREALGAIARRYVGFVYNAALRQVRDPHLAEDVTQAVFVILARKVDRLVSGTVLHAWLFTTTRYAARNALKMQSRRIHHEARAAKGRGEEVRQAPEITPLLDEALAELGEVDRSAVLLSYFGERSWREVGTAIGSSEDAARKRVGRAVAQMRRFFARNGMHVSSGAVASGLASAARAAAPPGLADSVVAGCITAAAASPAAVSAGSAGGIAEGVLSMMTVAKIKVAAAFAIGFLVTLGFASAMVMRSAAQDPPPQQQTRKSPAPAQRASVTLKDEITVELLEVTGMHGEQSWNGDGSPAPRGEIDADARGAAAGVGAGPGHLLVARVVAPETLEMDARWSVQPARTTTINHVEHGPEKYVYISTEPQKDQKTIDLRVEIASGEWKMAAARDGTDGMVMTGSVAFGEVHELDGRCAMTISDELLDQQVHIVAIDANGQEHPAESRGAGIGKSFRQSNVEFPLPADEIARIELRTRPYAQWVAFKNITLVPGQAAGFQVTSSGR